MITPAQYLSGKVKRWHTRHSIPPQTTADHSWGVAMILLQFCPNPSAALLRAAIIHDCGELVTGDIPGNFKRSNPELTKSLDALEDKAVADLGIARPVLTSEEELWLDFADKFEAWLYLNHTLTCNSRDWEIANRIAGIVNQLALQLNINPAESPSMQYGHPGARQ